MREDKIAGLATICPKAKPPAGTQKAAEPYQQPSLGSDVHLVVLETGDLLLQYELTQILIFDDVTELLANEAGGDANSLVPAIRRVE